MTCSVGGCGRKVLRDGLCGTHGIRKREGRADWARPIRPKRSVDGAPCAAPGCIHRATSHVDALPLCVSHRERKLKGRADWDAPLRPRRPRPAGVRRRRLDVRIATNVLSSLEVAAEARALSVAQVAAEVLEAWHRSGRGLRVDRYDEATAWIRRANAERSTP